MASASEHGRRWNVTPEEAVKLKALWMAVFDVTKIEHRQHQTAIPASSVSKKKWNVRVPLFGGKAQEDTDITPGNDSSRWTKDYQESLAKYTPDQLHQGLWNMPGGRHPDELLLRFLRARNWDVESALMMLVPAVTFINYDLHVYDDLLLRGDGIPEVNADPKPHQDFISQLRMGKGFIHGLDKDGRPILYIRARLHHQAEQSNLTMTRFIVYGIEMLRFVMPADVDTATLVFDLTGSSVSNIDLGPVRFIMTDQHFPETLAKVILYRAPWVMAGLWRSIRGWLDPETAYKVNFAANVDELEQHIPRESILKELGGDKEYTWEYVEPREGENAAMERMADRDQIIAARNELIKSFESETAAWVHGGNDGKMRDEIAEQLNQSFWELDPHIRARSVYDRLGMIKSGQ